MQWKTLSTLLFFSIPPNYLNLLTKVAFTSSIVSGDQVILQNDDGRPVVDIDRIPDEPPIQGGILSPSSEKQLESHNLESLPFDDSPVDGDGILPPLVTSADNSSILSRRCSPYPLFIITFPCPLRHHFILNVSTSASEIHRLYQILILPTILIPRGTTIFIHRSQNPEFAKSCQTSYKSCTSRQHRCNVPSRRTQLCTPP